LAGVGAGLGALAVAGGKGGSSGTSTPTPTSTPPVTATLSGVIAAGPLLSNNGVKLEAFDANGKSLGSTTDIKADGSYSITFNKVYSGIVKLVASDTNGAAANYVDEATGQQKDLGSTPLIAIYNVVASQANLPVNVNTITTDIANRVLIKVNNDLTSSVIAKGITDAKAEFAKAFNISDVNEVDNFFTTPPTLLFNANGALNSGTLDQLGLLLAVKSYMDANAGFTFKQAVDALASDTNYSRKWDSLTPTSKPFDGNWSTYIHTIANGYFPSLDSLPTGKVTISGSATQGLISGTATVAQQGQTLTADNSIKDADGIPTSGAGVISYQWQVSSDGAATWSNISGAVGSSFTLTQDQAGKQVKVVASYTDNYGTPESVVSDATRVDNPPTGAVTISGSATQGVISGTATVAQQGQTLTAGNSIKDDDGIPTSGADAISYQWKVSTDGTTWSNISGAVGSTFTLTQDQVSKQVKVVASYTDKLGTNETVESQPTSKILSPVGTTSTPLSAQALGAVQTFSAGDLNGDGIADFLFVYRGGDVSKGGLLGRAYVLYGNTDGKYDLSGPASGATSNTQVFQLEKAVSREILASQFSTQAGILPTVVNDFNGNGVGEIAFATQRAIVPEGGQTYSVSGNYIDFSDTLNGNSFPRIMNAWGDGSNVGLFNQGYSAISSGDINGDGFADLLVGDYGLDKVFILFGGIKPPTGNVFTNNIKSSNSNGVCISDSGSGSAPNPNSVLGVAVSYLGDTNGDGYGDMAISRSYGSSGGSSDNIQEEIFVIFGSALNKDIDVNQIRTGNGSGIGFVIKSESGYSFLAYDMGMNASKIYGDFNGDGLNDFIFEGNSYDHIKAKFYVMFGRKNDSTPIDLNTLGSKGFTISLPSVALKDVICIDSETTLITQRDMPRDTATNCGDINGDGKDDILITLAFNTKITNDANNKLNHFLAYVVYGKSDINNIDLNNLDDKGSSVYGYKIAEYSKKIPIASCNFYGNITAPGDINGDGIPDLIWDDYDANNDGANNLLPTVKLGTINNPLIAAAQNKFTANGKGTSGNDVLTGTTADETFAGGAGDDVIYGKGGADVVYGGAGNDTCYLNSINIAQLSKGVSTSGRLARIDGGGGIDTLAVDGSNAPLDLTLIADNRLQSIEKINLGATNSLKVSWSDIQNMAAMNLFNKASGWTGFSSDTAPYHQLVVDGQSDSKVSIKGSTTDWAQATTHVFNSTQEYIVYTNASHAAQLLVNTGCGTVIFY
jgi:hypothetical protein